MKVYVVAYSDYEAYSISGIFSKEEDAKIFEKLGYSCEEYEVDERLADPQCREMMRMAEAGYLSYEVHINEYGELSWHDNPPVTHDYYNGIKLALYYRDLKQLNAKKMLVVHCAAKSEDEAIAIAKATRLFIVNNSIWGIDDELNDVRKYIVTAQEAAAPYVS